MELPKLSPCPACDHSCSDQAASCPGCGHFFHDNQAKVRPGDGWSIAIFWGIMLAWIIPVVLSSILVAILFLIGVLGLASLSSGTPAQGPRPTDRR